MPSRKNKQPNTKENNIITQFFAELNREIEGDNVKHVKTTKGQALVEHLVNEALKGDQKMLTHLLKLIDRLEVTLDTLPSETEHASKADWELIFAFYGKYKTLIEQELSRLQQENPEYWTFDWCTPTLESAPWFEEMHEKRNSN